MADGEERERESGVDKLYQWKCVVFCPENGQQCSGQRKSLGIFLAHICTYKYRSFENLKIYFTAIVFNK